MSLLQFLSENLEALTLWVSITVATLGAIILFLIEAFWPRIARFYREDLAKIAVAFFRFVAAAAAVLGRVTTPKPDQAQTWIIPLLIAALGYLLWEIAGARGDKKNKDAKEKAAKMQQKELEALTQDLMDANLQASRLNWLITHLRQIANEKLQRIRRAITQGTAARASLQQTRAGLHPELQVHIILERLTMHFGLDAATSPTAYAQNFRVGLFAEEEGYLVPIAAFDLSTRSHEPFTSFRIHAARYRLDNSTNPSHAVRCVVESRMLIVADGHQTNGFEYFEEKQRIYLRSLVAYPLPDFRRDGVNSTRAALLLDTNMANYFQEDDREILELRLKEFAVRLNLEYAIKGLTS